MFLHQITQYVPTDRVFIASPSWWAKIWGGISKKAYAQSSVTISGPVTVLPIHMHVLRVFIWILFAIDTWYIWWGCVAQWLALHPSIACDIKPEGVLYSVYYAEASKRWVPYLVIKSPIPKLNLETSVVHIKFPWSVDSFVAFIKD